MIDSSGQNNDAGFALIVVIGFLFLASAIIIPFVAQSRLVFFASVNKIDQQRLGLLSDSLTLLFASRVVRNTVPDLVEDGRLLSCETGRFNVTASVQNHVGLVDLNAAPASSLAAALRVFNLTSSVAQSVAETIVISRSVSPPQGAFSGLDMIGGHRSRPFLSVTELTDIVSGHVFGLEALHGVFTVRSRTGQISQSVMSRRLKPKFAEQPDAFVLQRERPVAAGVRTIKMKIVELPKRIVKRSAQVFLLGSTEQPRFELLEKLIVPVGETGQESAAVLPCSSLFGETGVDLLSDLR